MADIYIDPRFEKPPNVIDVRDAGMEDGSEYYDFIPPEAVSVEENDLVFESNIPKPPTSFTLVSQTVRTTSDGSQVVDLILELPDQDGVKEYEIRIAKTE